VNLPHGHKRPRAAAIGSEACHERCAVALDRGLCIGLGEAEVEGVAAVGPRVAALARGESVDQPGNFFEAVGFEDLEFGLGGDPGRDRFILAGRSLGQESLQSSCERRNPARVIQVEIEWSIATGVAPGTSANKRRMLVLTLITTTETVLRAFSLLGYDWHHCT